MRFVLVVDRKHLFPGLSPQGLLSPDTVDLASVERQAFFAERDYVEHCSHFKQIIPYTPMLSPTVCCADFARSAVMLIWLLSIMARIFADLACVAISKSLSNRFEQSGCPWMCKSMVPSSA